MQSKIFRVIRMDIEIDVEYLQGNTAIKRKMKQKELAALLLDEDIIPIWNNRFRVISPYSTRDGGDADEYF